MKTIKNNFDLIAQFSLIIIGMAGIAASIRNLSVQPDTAKGGQPANVTLVQVVAAK
jgi:hypothetical protein